MARDKEVSPQRSVTTVHVADLHVEERAEKAAFEAMLPVERVMACQPPEADARHKSDLRDGTEEIFDCEIRHIELWYLLFSSWRTARVWLPAVWFSADESRLHRLGRLWWWGGRGRKE